MTTTLTITAAEWASVQDGTLWLVREGHEDDLDQFIREEGLPVEYEPLAPPAEFVSAAAPCDEPMCQDGTVLYPEWEGNAQPCGRCRIELVRECGVCGGGSIWPKCGTPLIHLGWGYAVDEALPITSPDEECGGATPHLFYEFGKWWGHFCDYPRPDDALAHYGPPESLVGKWALRVQVTP